MRLFLFAVLLSGVLPDIGDYESALLFLTGAASLESVSEDDCEMYRHLSDNPLAINTCSRARLMSCPLFTPFQAASLAEYRERSGYVLSFAELALVDGFSAPLSRALRHFVVLDAPAPDSGGGGKFRASAMARAVCGTSSAALSSKLHAECGSAVELDCCFKSEALPRTACVSLHSPSQRWSLYAGDYSARFGQGLLLWSGMQMTGFNSLQAFRRSSGGLAGSSSFTRSCHGLAVEYDNMRNRFSAIYAHSGVMALNYRHLTRRSCYGVTALGALGRQYAVSSDFRIGLNSLSLSGECVLQLRDPGVLRCAAILSSVWTPRYGTRLAMLGRFYQEGYDASFAASPSAYTSRNDEAGIALYAQHSGLLCAVDFAVRPSSLVSQLKCLASYTFRFCLPFSASAETELRSSTRYRPGETLPLREDLRADLRAERGRVRLNVRAEMLWNRSMSCLYYVEPGWVGESLSVYLRLTEYAVPSWDDRIYCYERDLPGTFSVPAYYGNGMALSAVTGARFRVRCTVHKLNFRAGLLSSVRPDGELKRGWELKLQYQLLLH